ncbi:MULTISPECIES: LacI family DNA-binding transcriptional regulator [Halocynthiibacter]|uniref:LacI family transcriptional regulator n=1 Tax=Halocynthiibacter halioticoli TaxID=2986804 RepID=A0AAE3LQL3_9RHOB|nr:MULTISPECIES: LacI family DNA-binding transcriptional regulator [Halocynthiibacter]MCV6824562.1 LacI family transcriptional regulator [Halocynthiibacter halioticoli]MCW4057563.1 LacI family transcriptional regulator [Halocynthiibacter sp. SDUM655004]
MATSRTTNPTLKDIAKAAGVSVAAVSKVLNNREGVGEDTRQRILTTIDELGYNGRAGRDSIVGSATILTLEQYVTNDAFYGEILESVKAASLRSGLDIGISVYRSATDMRVAVEKSTVGGPLMLMGVDQPDIVDAVIDRGLTGVIVNGMDRSMQLTSVSPDYHFGAALATQHLISLGHKDILHVTHPYRESIRRRIDGFRNALEEAGIAFNPEQHILDLGAPQNISLAARDIVLQRLKHEPVPTAIFCMNDMVALGAMQAAQSLGLSVPDDISIVGFDGLSIGEYATPPLTSVQTNRASLGEIGVSLLVERINQPTAAVQRVTTGGKLIVRRSSTTSPR